MRARHEIGGRNRPPISVARHDERLVRADAVRIRRDALQPVAADDIGVGEAHARGQVIERHAAIGDELDLADRRARAQALEIAGLEALDEHRRGRVAPAVRRERTKQRIVKAQAERFEIRGVLGFRIDADAFGLRQRADLVERGDRLVPVERRVGRAQLRQPFAATQRLQLREREVLGEPALLLAPVHLLLCTARCELRS